MSARGTRRLIQFAIALHISVNHRHSARRCGEHGSVILEYALAAGAAVLVATAVIAAIKSGAMAAVSNIPTK